jgi:hypothetical protein
MGKVKLPYPHKGQEVIRTNARRFNWLSAGRRWRKTTLAMSIAVEAAARDGQKIFWGAPTYDQVRVCWAETRTAAGGYADFNVQRMEATFPSGGQIVYRSLDNPDNARGHTADGVVMDECADISSEGWYEVLRPMLIDTGGWAWGIGTPKGRNWFWQEHAKALDRTDTAAWQVPTLGVQIVDGQLVREPHALENPEIPFDEIVQLWETLPARTFEQEILAQFVEQSGSVFRGVRDVSMASRVAPYAGTFRMGVDWGQANDFTVLTVFDAETRSMVDLDRFNKVDWALQRARLTAMADKWKVDRILAEKNSIGGPNIEELRRAGLPVLAFDTTAVSKPPLIESLVLAIEKREVTLLNDPVLINELEAYERTVSKDTGRSKYSAPEGMHDDSVISCALGWKAVNTARMVAY